MRIDNPNMVQFDTSRLAWWDRSRDDYKFNGLMWPPRLGIDSKFDSLSKRYSTIEGAHQVEDQHPCVVIESGQMVDWGQSDYMEPPVWEPHAMETIIVRPIIKWAGRVSR